MDSFMVRDKSSIWLLVGKGLGWSEWGILVLVLVIKRLGKWVKLGID